MLAALIAGIANLAMYSILTSSAWSRDFEFGGYPLIEVSGVLFTCETETGHADFVQVDSLYGLGESIVQGRAIPDEFMVHKPTFREGHPALPHPRLKGSHPRVLR